VEYDTAKAVFSILYGRAVKYRSVNMAWSKRVVLRAGFAAVIAVLVFSAFEAYRIQNNISRQHMEIYRRFVQQDEALATLRKNLWLSGNYVRDFFINSTPAQGAIFARQLLDLENENETAFRVLELGPNRDRVVPQLRSAYRDLIRRIQPLPQTMQGATNNQEMEFLEKEIVPRRGDLYSALRALTLADEQTLLNSEGQFGEARRAATRGLLAMLCLGVLLSVLVARFSLRHSENLERKAELHFAQVEQAREELQQLSARLLEIEEEGRRRLSRELHDEIGQTLALLQIEISHAAKANASPETSRTRLERARGLAERCVQTIRNMSGLLRPALLDDLGLVPALQFQLEDFIRRSGIACEFVEENVSAELPDAIKTCVYRIVQEALHNAEKHSGARVVKVSVRQYPDRLVAEIHDDGIGFASDHQGRPSRSTGLGLLGMRERAATAGGSLTVDSAAGRGVRIVLQIPLPAARMVRAGVVKEVNA
jgi:signal transduction histidine kinase